MRLGRDSRHLQIGTRRVDQRAVDIEQDRLGDEGAAQFNLIKGLR
jgi:hypothetical protein